MNRCIDCNKLLRSRNTICQIEKDTDKERGKKMFTQTFRCRACLEKLISLPPAPAITEPQEVEKK